MKKKSFESFTKERILFLALAIHVMLLCAVFDIYFNRPLEENLQQVRSTNNPPANRVFLLVVSGLRAESIFGNYNRAPFLTEIAQHTGVWDVAHVKIPTVSQTGINAILAGVYQDPTELWKTNLNHTVNTVLDNCEQVWYFGASGVVESKENTHVETCKKEVDEDNTILMDKCTLERVETFLKLIGNCTGDCEGFHEGEAMYFIYLSGVAATGYKYKPNSPEYVQSIFYIDRAVEKLYKLANEVFPDNRTTFVLTSDHGITNWGTYGGASPQETEIPLIAWGAGIHKTNIFTLALSQVDIAPFLATLLGVNIPTNSLGVTPMHFLNITETHLATIRYSNARQLTNKFKAKKVKFQNNSMLEIPFSRLTLSDVDATLNNLHIANYTDKHEFFIKHCNRLIRLLVEGIEYYNTYYQIPIELAISVGLFEWIIYLICRSTLEKSSLTAHQKKTIIFINCGTVLLCLVQRLLYRYYLYFCFPSAMFSLILPYFKELKEVLVTSKSKVGKKLAIYFLGIEFIVFGFKYRFLLSLLNVILPLLILSLANSTNNLKSFKILWVVLSVILSVFPFLPVMINNFNIATYTCGYLMWFILLNLTFNALSYYDTLRPKDIRLFYVQFFFSALAFFHVVLLENEIIPTKSLLNILSWVYFSVPIVIVLISKQRIPVRLASIFFGFLPYYLLVSFNIEVVFLALFVATLCVYLSIEDKCSNGNLQMLFLMNFTSYHTKAISAEDSFRRAFFFISFIVLGYFGAGNVSSLSAYNPLWVRAFLTEDFVTMSVLIALKLTVPFLFTCCVFRSITLMINQESAFRMLCFTLAICSFIILQLILSVRNGGSFVEFGTSLSNLVLAEMFSLVSIVMYGMVYLLTSANFRIFRFRFLERSEIVI